MRLRNKFVFLIIGLFLITFFIYYIAGKLKGETYAEVIEKDIERKIYFTGILKPEKLITVRSEVSGYVKDIYVYEGQFVRAGTILAELEHGTLIPLLEEIVAKRKQIVEKLSPDSPWQSAIKAQLEGLKTELSNLNKKYERRYIMFKEGLISREELEDIELKKALVERRYKETLKSYENALEDLKNELKILNIKLKKIEFEVNKYKIRAPINGFVVKKFVEKGEYINHIYGENRLFLIGSGQLMIEADVSLEYIDKLLLNQTVTFYPENDKNRKYLGRIVEIEKILDPAKKSIKMKIRPEESIDEPVYMTVEIEANVGKRKAVLIPEGAVDKNNEVWVKGKGKVKVTLGRKFGNYIEVIDGVKPGDLVKIK